MTHRLRCSFLPWLAALSVLAASLWAHGRFAAFSAWQHPLGLPGGDGVPGAWLYNVGVFIVPGAALMIAAWCLRAAMPAATPAWQRVSAQAWMLAGLGFALQGVWRLSADGPDVGSSRGHATAWLLWWLAWSLGALGVARHARRCWPTAAALAVLLPIIVLVWPTALSGGIAQRVAVAYWLLASTWLLNRASTSAREWSPTVGR